MASVRTRFAPSPTGYLHIGGARTALYNWLFARQSQGQFLLRIEDTDRERSTDEATQAILEGLSWLGLDWDEQPVFQSARADEHRRAAKMLLEQGHAYRCFCTKDELDEARKAAEKSGGPTGYSRKCRDRTDEPDLPCTVRFKMPLDGETVVADQIRGDVTFPNAQLDDLILLRSDDSPTYNLSVVVDDAFMKITHALRGDDHLNNTPKQIQLYQALGLSAPLFGHMPLILGTDKKRLSKRHGATSVIAYRDLGYQPEALVNFLARIGWGMADREIFSRDDLLEHFQVSGIGGSAGVYDPDKLNWVSQEWIKRRTPTELIAELRALVENVLPEDHFASEDEREQMVVLLTAHPLLESYVPELQERHQTLIEILDALRFLVVEQVDIDPKAQKKWLKAGSRAALEATKELIASLTEPIDADAFERSLKGVSEQLEIGMGKVAQPLRVAVTGTAQAPPIHRIVEVAGKGLCLRRIDAVLAGLGED